ncbi:hypothetical protein PV341_12125 [Streptomyces sp. PA03-1a]|nr:hypothetical protein [Streptomyces sp. PA03-1a]
MPSPTLAFSTAPAFWLRCALPPEQHRRSPKSSLAQKLTARARTAWTQPVAVHVRHRGQSAYVDGKLAYGDSIELMRLRHSRSATTWGFALYLANTDKYEDTLLTTSSFADTAEGALDYACGLYLATPDI